MTTDPVENTNPSVQFYPLNSNYYYPFQLVYWKRKNILFYSKSGGVMYTYDLLEAGCHYLVKEKEDSMITLIKVAMESDHCLFIMKFEDPTDTEWKLKKDPLFDIIECLSDTAVKEWELYYKSNQDAYTEEDDED